MSPSKDLILCLLFLDEVSWIVPGSERSHVAPLGYWEKTACPLCWESTSEGFRTAPQRLLWNPVEGVKEDDSHPGRMEQDSLRLVHTTGNRVWFTTQVLFIRGIFYFKFSSHSSIVQMENLESETAEKRKDMASTHHTETSQRQWGFDRNSKWQNLCTFPRAGEGYNAEWGRKGP